MRYPSLVCFIDTRRRTFDICMRDFCNDTIEFPILLFRMQLNVESLVQRTSESSKFNIQNNFKFQNSQFHVMLYVRSFDGGFNEMTERDVSYYRNSCDI